MHILQKEIILNANPETVWEFLATPVNLDRLTPPDLRFKILSPLPDRMYNGLTILYEIQIPLFGTHRWLTEIKHIREGTYFVDEQRFGPYRFWYHEHLVEPLDQDRTTMVDQVTYQLPFGIIGSLVHRLWVKKMLADIFDFRTRRLEEIFNTDTGGKHD